MLGQAKATKTRPPKPRRGVGGREARTKGACPQVRAKTKNIYRLSLKPIGHVWHGSREPEGCASWLLGVREFASPATLKYTDPVQPIS